MSFLKTWSPYFKSNVRMRGRAIQSDGRVKLVTAEVGEFLRVEVQGRQVSTVTVRDDEDSDTPAVRCTCQHFQGGMYCKHIWATLLALKYGPSEMPEVAAVLEHASPRPPKARRRAGGERPARGGEPKWLGRLALLRVAGAASRPAAAALLPRAIQIGYVIEPEASTRYGELVVQLRQRQPGSGRWQHAKPLKINAAEVADLPEAVDRQLCALVLGGVWIGEQDGSERSAEERARSTFRIRNGAWRALLRRMIDTGRCLLDAGAGEPKAVRWDEEAGADVPWRPWLTGSVDEQTLTLTVELRRDGRQMPIEQPQLVLGGRDGLIVCDGVAAPFDDGDASRWVSQFRDDARFRRDTSPITVPRAEIGQFLDRLYALPQLPEIELPAGVGRPALDVAPARHIELHSPGAASTNQRGKLLARVWFAYGDQRIRPGQPGRYVTIPGPATETAAAPDAEAESGSDAATTLIRRDPRWEAAALAQLAALGFRPHPGNGPDWLALPLKQMPAAVGDLLATKWHVTADKHVIRRPGATRLSVASGIDWFELRGSVRYETDTGSHDVPLPDILAAARRGQEMVTLDDGTRGLLPVQWLDEHGLLTAIGQVQDDHLRFKSSQSALLDALLKRQELVDVDERFEQARQRLQRFERIEPLDPAPTFHGTLRAYQKDAMGWFEFLRWFGIGGILADDMGLGKTVQVLAMLDAWYGRGAQNDPTQPDRPHRPTLIVVPRSVVFNWMDEAQRFAPQLRVQDYTGTDRNLLRDAFDQHDVIVTSYGLMRRDIKDLHRHEFDYVVLDEAQVVKNPNSQSAKAARLLQTGHRLALTGTPIENHIGDLWSIFEFLNPGMLGGNTRFAQLLRNGAGRARLTPDDEDTEGNDAAGAMTPAAQGSYQVAQALRPFILRRTKQQVLHELPEKTEQTILCEMEGAQRRVYEQLRQHYRGTLLRQRADAGDRSVRRGLGGVGAGSTMMVLEALLRLRQAACHPGLIDSNRAKDPSAKLEALLDALTELIDEGHKALVFSQFTSMLALVRDRLGQMQIPYAYLDGQTTNRRDIVRRFQTDPACPVFLISLKAGGLGLNLTAAEYVFILDPWWNPAVEQQAIDRTHRIGQTRHVFAYRMICQDTIEQRIAELQEKKKKLADAIIGGEKSLLSSLTRDDLERLLS